ncbi:hypothetical protein BDA99DRAFT_436682 [Phascolomyces articulosus]|uniref:SMAD/FHA domain-containing protein n=1 Tax=Phascolomyces articulosus TaxID=60185 RepID=A0AAD5K2A9_9FUNG|nr:hypothetical protein BDA99DRAFT_436682 [Phascolomyces articulosus]
MAPRSPFSLSRSTSTASTPHRSAHSSSNTNIPHEPSPNDDGEVHIRLVPHVTYNSQCHVFDVIERSLQQGVILKLGRYNNNRRTNNSNHLSFKSKVVSRSHAELWCENGRVYIRDTSSSTGTFVNRIRLPPVDADFSLSAKELSNGDIIQLGVDYQLGIESIYRAVRMRLQFSHHRPTNNNQEQIENEKKSSFSKAAFQQLCGRITSNNKSQSFQQHSNGHDHLHHDSTLKILDRNDIQECCICLYAVAPTQALFVAPCSHVFHFKCLRPLIELNFPAFSCPLCRTYSDLQANVEIDIEDILETSSDKNFASPTVIEEQSSSSSSAFSDTADTGPSTARNTTNKIFSGSSPFIKHVLFSSANGLRSIITS